MNGNTFYVDSASSAGTVGSYLDEKDCQVLAILFHGDTTGDTLILKDIKQFNDNVTVAAGALKMEVVVSAADTPQFLNFQDCALRFPNGIWVSSISSGSATLVVKLKS